MTTARSFRPSGLAMLVGVVVVGMLASAVLFRAGWTRVEAVEARNSAAREAGPDDPLARLDLWLRFGEPQLQNRLIQLRFSSAHPGLITHTVVRADGPDEIWGVDLSGSHPARIERDGLVLTAVLAEPRLLGHGVLTGMNAQRVPAYPPDAVPDPEARARELCDHFLGELRDGLERDIDGATLRFAFEPRDLPATGAGERG